MEFCILDSSGVWSYGSGWYALQGGFYYSYLEMTKLVILVALISH